MNMSNKGVLTIIDVLQRASGFGNKQGYVFIHDDGNEMDYSQIFNHAKAIAVELRETYDLVTGDRALLVFSPEGNFITAYFGCLCAGVVAVPVIPPSCKATSEKLQFLIEDAKPSILLTNQAFYLQLNKLNLISLVPGCFNLLMPKTYCEVSRFSFDNLRWVITDKVDMSKVDKWKQPDSIIPTTVTMLQYTSGSTSTPKGVVITHKNLLHNLTLIQKQFGLRYADK